MAFSGLRLTPVSLSRAPYHSRSRRFPITFAAAEPAVHVSPGSPLFDDSTSASQIQPARAGFSGAAEGRAGGSGFVIREWSVPGRTALLCPSRSHWLGLPHPPPPSSTYSMPLASSHSRAISRSASARYWNHRSLRPRRSVVILKRRNAPAPWIAPRSSAL